MTNACKDCSYRGSKSGPSGECPACGSFKFAPVNGQPVDEVKPGAKFQRIALVTSWTVLLFLILLKIFE